MDLVFVSFDYAAKHWNELCGASTEVSSAAKHFNVLCGEAL
jgi:hypothetical protein